MKVIFLGGGGGGGEGWVYKVHPEKISKIKLKLEEDPPEIWKKNNYEWKVSCKSIHSIGKMLKIKIFLDISDIKYVEHVELLVNPPIVEN